MVQESEHSQYLFSGVQLIVTLVSHSWWIHWFSQMLHCATDLRLHCFMVLPLFTTQIRWISVSCLGLKGQSLFGVFSFLPQLLAALTFRAACVPSLKMPNSFPAADLRNVIISISHYLAFASQDSMSTVLVGRQCISLSWISEALLL